jgi:Type II secretion system protein C
MPTPQYEISEVKLASKQPLEPESLLRRVLKQVFTLRTLIVAVVAAVAIYSLKVLTPAITDKAYVRKDQAPTSNSEAPIVGDPSMPLAQRSVLGTTSSLSAEPLRLFLMATQPGESALQGTAQLGTDPRNPQTFGVGSVLANGSKLVEIHADRVVLERGGQRTELRVDQQGGIAAAGPQVVPSPKIGISSAAARERELASVQADRSAVAKPLPTPIGSIRDINEVARAQPVFKEKELTGFAVMPGSQAGRFAGLGLESGDVVIAVEGRVVTAPTQWNQLSAALLAGQSVNVTVERKGQTIAMALDGDTMVKGNAQPAMPPPPMGPPPMGPSSAAPTSAL